jgi:hypothetical protein
MIQRQCGNAQLAFDLEASRCKNGPSGPHTADENFPSPHEAYFTGKQSRSFANASGPGYRFLISA